MLTKRGKTTIALFILVFLGFYTYGQSLQRNNNSLKEEINTLNNEIKDLKEDYSSLKQEYTQLENSIPE